MDNAMQLATIIGPVFLVIGLSILFYAEQWLKLVKGFAKDHFMLLFGSFFSLIIGLILINMHNAWEWNWELIITLTGWGMFLKGAFYFLAPGEWTKGVLQSFSSLNVLYVDGVLATVLGAYLSYLAYLV